MDGKRKQGSGGPQATVLTSWSQKPELSYTSVQLLLKEGTWPRGTLRRGLGSNVMTDRTLAHCLTATGRKGKLGPRSVGRKLSTESSDLPQGRGGDGRAPAELGTASASRRESGGLRPKAKLCVETGVTSEDRCRFSVGNYALSGAHPVGFLVLAVHCHGAVLAICKL